MHRNEVLLRMAYEAQARGDLDAYLALLTEDFVLHVPGRSQMAGDYSGKEAVRRHFRDIADRSGGTFRTAVHDVAVSDDHVIALVNARAIRDGEIVELPRVHVWHVKGQKLSELWIHPADQYVFDEYWG